MLAHPQKRSLEGEGSRKKSVQQHRTCVYIMQRRRSQATKYKGGGEASLSKASLQSPPPPPPPPPLPIHSFHLSLSLFHSDSEAGVVRSTNGQKKKLRSFPFTDGEKGASALGGISWRNQAEELEYTHDVTCNSSIFHVQSEL